jgi:uncharacterized membrane protein YgaE (UPF0421/DUF939 family)
MQQQSVTFTKIQYQIIYVLNRLISHGERMMNAGKTLGFSLFIGGILLLILYGLYLGFEEIMSALDVISGVLIGITIVGFFILIISIVIEQHKNTKTTMKDISKEDLKP